MARQLTWAGFGWRLVVATLLVFASWNPSGWSFWHWVFRDLPDVTAVKALVGIGLVIGWAIYLRATMRSLGGFGTVLVAALFAALMWLAVDFGWIAWGDFRMLAWVGLAALSVLLGLGMSWSHVRRRISGQYDMDDVEQ